MKKLIKSLESSLVSLKNHKASLLVLLGTVLFFIVDDLTKFQLSSERGLFFIYVTAVLLFLGVLFSEFLAQDRKKWFLFAGAAALALFLGLMYRPYMYENDIFGTFASARVSYAVFGTGMILTVLILYVAFRKSGKQFGSFTERVFRNAVLTALLSGLVELLFMGLMLIIYVLFDTFPERAARIGSVLIFSGVFVPGLIVSLRETEQEPEKVFRVVSRIILPVFEVLAILISYAYILRILIRRTLPSNFIFPVVTVLFVIFFVAWMIDASDEQTSVFSKIRKWIPAAFIPLLAIQSFALFLRIAQYGFTARRYIGLMLLIFEALTVVLWIAKRAKLSLLLPVLAGMILLLTILPGLNIPMVERWSGERQWSGNDPDSMTGDLTENDEDLRWVNLYEEALAPTIELQGYQRLRRFRLDEEAFADYDYREGYQVDYTAVPVVYADTGEKDVLDLQAYFSAVIDFSREHPNDEKTEFLRSLNPQTAGNGRAVYVDELTMSFEQTYRNDLLEREIITQFEMEGFVLE